MIGKIFGSAVLLFFAALLIWQGVKLLASIWWILAILAVGTIAVVIYLRISGNKPKW